jgi:hypothetical protein
VSSEPLSFRQISADRVEVGSWATYRYDGALPKPCVHPLVTPRGHVLSGFEMSDHVWHRGLWFTIKFVNGANFWEEQPPFGVQVSRSQPVCELVAPRKLRITHRLKWTSEATGAVIDEMRMLTFRSDGVIDWATELRARKDLTLDRTPFTTWGGYGGLAFRAARELHDVNFLLPNGDTASALAGQSHAWTVMQAKVDGGAEQHVSIGMIDHPANPRSPSPWYCKSGNGFNYMNPALLFHEPMSLKEGDLLRLRYRVMHRDGFWTPDEFASAADQIVDPSEEDA